MVDLVKGKKIVALHNGFDKLNFIVSLATITETKFNLDLMNPKDRQ